MYFASVIWAMIYFGIYKSLKPNLLEKLNPTVALMLSSLIADVGSYFIYYPLDCIKTRLQIKQHIDIKQTIKQHGIGFFYRGAVSYTAASML